MSKGLTLDAYIYARCTCGELLIDVKLRHNNDGYCLEVQPCPICSHPAPPLERPVVWVPDEFVVDENMKRHWNCGYFGAPCKHECFADSAEKCAYWIPLKQEAGS